MTPTLAAGLAFLLLAADGNAPFRIKIIDEQTGRGVPLVELRTVHDVLYVTDSAGVAAVCEPGLMGQTVYFSISSHGYEFPVDGFGFRGRAFALEPGGAAQAAIRRQNAAERLYRVTGAGIYSDSVALGDRPPIQQPLVNGLVLGQDSVLSAVYQARIRWFWGDTNRPAYPLGNFHASGATSLLPGEGGLDPSVGVDLAYFTDDKGFSRPMAKMPGQGPTWLDGLVVLKDADGRERMFAAYVKIKPPMDVYERGLVEYDPHEDAFRQVCRFDLDFPVYPHGHPIDLVVSESGQYPGDVPSPTGDGPQAPQESRHYIYFCGPFPLVRVPAQPDSLADLARFEAFTYLAPGSRKDKPEVHRDGQGRIILGWKANTPPPNPSLERELIRDGKLKREEALLALRDVETGKPVLAHNGSTYWNAWRKRYVTLFVEQFGSSFLGEVWYVEADAPTGPWTFARRIVTHKQYSFYNPKQHPFFDQEGGRLIYFEGTYTTTFSGNPAATPRYNYNQIMYRLDLADSRLVLPVPVYQTGTPDLPRLSTNQSHPPAVDGSDAGFLAPDRPGMPGTYPVVWANGRLELLSDGNAPPGSETSFYALPADLPEAPPGTAILEVHDSDPTYRLRQEGTEGGRPVCRVWTR
jgi:hypothetical protein